MELGALLVVGVVFGVISGVVASGKGHSFALWGIVGFVFGLLGLVITLCLSDKKAQNARGRTGRPRRSVQRMACPDCGESISAQAKKCRFCGVEIAAEDRPRKKRRR